MPLASLPARAGAITGAGCISAQLTSLAPFHARTSLCHMHAAVHARRACAAAAQHASARSPAARAAAPTSAWPLRLLRTNASSPSACGVPSATNRPPSSALIQIPNATATPQHTNPPRPLSSLPQSPTSPPAARSSACASAAASASASASRSAPIGSDAAALRVVVVGAGVVGLTTALRILQAGGACVSVTLVADKVGTDTTTAGAAGVWGPYKLSDTPEADIIRWGAATYDHLLGLVHSAEGVRAGASMLSCYSLYQEPGGSGAALEPFWRDIVTCYSLLNDRQLARFNGGYATDAGLPPPGGTGAGKYRWGYFWTSVVCEGRLYMPWLAQQLAAAGATVVQRHVTTLAEAVAAVSGGCDVLVNCAGLGSYSLVNDGQMYPIRGQVHRVRAPWITEAYFADPYYIIPNVGSVVLGGTGQVGNWDTRVSAEDKARIMAGCTSLMPSLASAEPLADWVGLRPGRTRLRLEMEELDLEAAEEAGGPATDDGGQQRRRRRRRVPVVHNYGHGGAGLTLAWGCAGDVVALMRAGQMLPRGG